MTTIVSALLTNINCHRNIDKYIEYGKILLNIPVNKVIFIEKHIFETYLKEYENENTVFHFIEKKDLYLYEHYNDITNFQITSTNYDKDTLEYMFVICNKTEWVKKAIVLNLFHTDNVEDYMWVDFGIYHMCKNTLSPKEFQEKTISIASNQNAYNSVRIGSIINPMNNMYISNNSDVIPFPSIINNNIYTDVQWFFAGPIFSGPSKHLLTFADLTKQKCLQIIKERKTLMWEVNVWYLVFLENPQLFSLYNCDHNHTIVDNYNK